MRSSYTLSALFLASLLILVTGSCSRKKVENDLLRWPLHGKVESIEEKSFRAIDQSGIIVRGPRETPPDMRSDRVAFFDTRGNLTEIFYYDSDDRPAGRVVFLRSDDNRRVERYEYGIDGRRVSLTLIRYNSEGRRLERTNYSSDTISESRTFYRHDSRGNVIDLKWYSTYGTLLMHISSEFDKRGHKISEKEYDNDNVMVSRRVYTNDPNGNSTEMVEYNADGAILTKRTYTYEYDSIGNWLKMVVFEEGIPKYIRERKIQYY